MINQCVFIFDIVYRKNILTTVTYGLFKLGVSFSFQYAFTKKNIDENLTLKSLLKMIYFKQK